MAAWDITYKIPVVPEVIATPKPVTKFGIYLLLSELSKVI
jgi:hypothetical protein